MLFGGMIIAFQLTVREGLVKGGVHSQLSELLKKT